MENYVNFSFANILYFIKLVRDLLLDLLNFAWGIITFPIKDFIPGKIDDFLLGSVDRFLSNLYCVIFGLESGSVQFEFMQSMTLLTFIFGLGIIIYLMKMIYDAVLTAVKTVIEFFLPFLGGG